MNLLAIIVIIICLITFFGVGILWAMQLFGKVKIPEKQSGTIFSLVIVCILTVSGGFVSTIFHQVQYDTDSYIGFMSDNRQIQAALRYHEFYKGELDGVLGNGTLGAVKRFQESRNDLPPTGGLDKETLEELFAYRSEPPFSFNRYFDRVKTIQTIFQKEGLLDEAQINGVYDERFLSAVGEFQTKHKIKYDQDLGTDTLLKLIEYELNIFKKFDSSTDE